MPLFYSLEGLSSPYSSPSVAPVGAAFASVLSTEMSRMGVTVEQAPNRRSRTKFLSRDYGAPAVAVHERKPALTAADVMTAPAECIALDASVKDAHELMARKRYRHLPVVSNEGKLTGILSDRDVLRAGTDLAKPVHLQMTTQVLTATPETPIRQIAEALLRHRIGALPIVDADHKTIGIITTSDILKAVVQRAPLELWA